MKYSEFYNSETPEIKRALNCELCDFPQDTFVRTVTVPRNSFIMRQGDESWQVYVLLNGKTLIYTQQINFSLYLLGSREPISFFGHFESLGGMKTISANVKTSEKCRFLVISPDDYLRWIRKSPDLLFVQCSTIIKNLLRQGELDRNMLSFESKYRLAYFFCNYYDIEQLSVKCNNVKICMSQNDIAENIGLSLRTITRAIADFDEDGMITRNNGKIYINSEQVKKLKATLTMLSEE